MTRLVWSVPIMLAAIAVYQSWPPSRDRVLLPGDGFPDSEVLDWQKEGGCRVVVFVDPDCAACDSIVSRLKHVADTSVRFVVAGYQNERDGFIRRHDLAVDRVFYLRQNTSAFEGLRDIGVRVTPVRAVVSPTGTILDTRATSSASMADVPAICEEPRS